MQVNKTKLQNAIIVLSLFLFAVMAFCVVQFNFVTQIDLKIIHFVQKILTKLPVLIPIVISELGFHQAMVIPLLIAGVFLIKGKKFVEFFALIIATEFSYVWMYVIKNIVQRARPPIELRLIDATGFSFPSGHSTIAMCFYGFLILLVFKYIKNKMLKYTLAILFSLMILLTCVSRIWLGVHYPSDVLCGLLLGLAWCLAVFKYGNKFFT